MIKHTLCAVLVAVALVGCNEQEKPTAAGIPSSLPGNVCVVSGEKIGEGGMKPGQITYQGQTIKFCCADCVDSFKKSPDKYVAALKSGKPLPKEEHAH